MMKSLKDLPYRIQTPKLKERVILFEDLSQDLSGNPDVPETVVKGLCRVVPLTLHLYNDSKSRRIVLEFVSSLLKLHGNATFKYMATSLSDVSNGFKNLVHTRNTGRVALTAFTWSCITLQSASKVEDVSAGDAKMLVEAMGVFLSAVCGANHKQFAAKAFRRLHSCLGSSEKIEEICRNAWLSVPSSPFSIVFGVALLRFHTEGKSQQQQIIKEKLLDHFLKEVLSCKSPPPEFIYYSCEPLLKQVSHEEWKKKLLPVVLKALLRSPETSLKTAACLLGGLAIDLSPYALDIGKNLSGSLCSKEDTIRDNAVDAFKKLGMQCSDGEVLGELVTYCFGIFNGSQGKLAIQAQKISILNCIGNLSLSPVSSSSLQSLCTLVADQFIKVLEAEVHEGTLLVALQMLSMWCKRFTAQAPPSLIEWFKKCMGLKSSTANVRTAYIHVMHECFRGDNLNLGVQFAPVLIKAVDKAALQNTQVALVNEGLAASSMILKLVDDDLKTENLSNFWNILTDMDKLVFFNDKYLQQAPDSALHDAVCVCERLLVEHTHRTRDSSGALYRAILLALNHHSSTVRTHTATLVRRMLSSLGGSKHARGFLDEALGFLDSRVAAKDEESSTVHVLVSGFKTLAAVGSVSSKTEAFLLAKCSLLPMHHSSIVEGAPRMWEWLLNKWNVKPSEFIANEIDYLMDSVIYNYDGSSSMKNTVGTLCRLAPNIVIPAVVSQCLDKLNNPGVREASRNDVFILNTPEGQLHDTSIISNFKEENHLNMKNMKRESKAYSYREQMEEIALRKEIEEKKRKAGKWKEPELTPKQKEAVKVQLEKESDIRRKLQELQKEVSAAVSLCEAAVEGDGCTFSKHLMEFLPCLLQHFSAPLSAPIVTQLFLLLRNVVFTRENRSTGELLAYTIVRILEPECACDKAWEAEPLDKALVRAVNLVYKETVTDDSTYTAPGFCYCFPLLQAVLKKSYEDEELVNKVLSIVSNHCKMRGDETEGVTDLEHPDLLPRKEMMESLLDFINRTGGRIQQQASNTLLDLAAAASGNEGCALTDEGEVTSLLHALRMQNEGVRDAALRALIEVSMTLPPIASDNPFSLQILCRLWVAKFDTSENIRELAVKLEEELVVEAMEELCDLILDDVVIKEEVIQEAASLALADCIQQFPSRTDSTTEKLLELYKERLPDNVSVLLPLFENFLDEAPKSSSYDCVRQSIVIVMGSLARHLEKTDPKIKPIVAKLIEALSTPSQQVQEAVANCLPPLVPAIKDDAGPLVKKLLHLLLESQNYGERKGAAYGLAGLVKGLGILALKQLNIMNSLTEAIQDKKSYKHREGALFAFEMLCSMLGRLFEPYIVHVLPHLLLCFGDNSQYVREAADDCARAVMSKLSAHGVKLVLPSLLVALEDDSWRTKTGSVELLGAMAYCAPKQLSSCLPSIVPKLIEVLGNSHQKVQKAGAQALRVIGSVIRNPEIQAIVPVLLEALQDPARKTSPCLQTLLDTKFVHFIDAPSLALIMPVVQRAFQDRSTVTRKMAAQIIGNMYSLTDQKDLNPYLPNIMPGLKMSLLDPVPEVRSVSARALGAMVKGMGESSFEELLPWLMQTLTSESSSVDRSGAAQGLSEVVGGLGLEKLNKLMPEVISTAERCDIAPHVKDGYIMMFIYLPVVFQQDFTPYIGQIIKPILKALADENEYVRDTALRAGQRIVNMYAETAIVMLLPELEKGLFDDNWRIRYSSVKLLGDLLYKISGVSGKMSTETADEDDNFGTEQSHKAIIIALGLERRNRVLAGLYMGRSDVALMVRQAALHVWKVVVTNTPRTLREILPTLFSLLLGCLASTSFDKRQVAARTLGDLVRKLGERVLPEIIPILERGLESEHSDQRQGVCIGLSEIMASTSREMVQAFSDSLVPTVKRALSDPLPEVRMAAAKTFDSLHCTVGSRALDDILPAMLKQLNNPELSEYTLDGLRQVMAIKSRVVLPYLVPQLTSRPVNTKALSVLACVAGDSLTRHLTKILPALLTALSESLDTENEQMELSNCQAVVLSVSDDQGARNIVDEFLEATRSDDVKVRRAAVLLLATFCRDSRFEYTQYVTQLLRGLIHLLTDTNPQVLHTSWEALAAITKKLSANDLLGYVGELRQAVRFAAADLPKDQLLPGFCLPKGISGILPIFREAILNGTPELKESSAQGLGEVIKLTSADALRPTVVHITGPLIRILGDRFAASVKVAVLDTLALMLLKVNMMMKAFLPQLQTTFLKALNDGNRSVRLKAAVALSHLIVIHTRSDPLFTELHQNIKTADEPHIKETMLAALRGVVIPAGDKIGDSIRRGVIDTLCSGLGYAEEGCRRAAAGCLGSLCRWLSSDELNFVTNNYLLEMDSTKDWMVRHGCSAALFVVLKECPNRIYDDYSNKIETVLLAHMASDRVPICQNGIRGVAYLLKHLMTEEQPLPQHIITPFMKSLNHSSNEVKALVASSCLYLAQTMDDAPLPVELMKAAVPALANGTKEKNSIVRSTSEFALVAILRLRHNDDTLQECNKLLDAGARESLNDVINKVLRKVANQPECKEEELDDTLLT